jgi:hypothetical protein
MRDSYASALVFLLSLFVAVHVQNCTGAGTPAIDINPVTQVSDSGVPGTWFGFDEFTLLTNGMYGWTFGLTEASTVTGLAWYDQGLDGLSHEHQVGLWQYEAGSTNVNGIPYRTNAPLLFSIIIPAGTNAPLEVVWRKVDLGSPVELGAGVYVIAGTHYTENPDVVEFVSGMLLSLPGDPRMLVGVPAFSNSGLQLRYYDPNAPIFRIPDNFILAPGVELGPNLFLLPKTIQQNIPSLGANTFSNQIVLSWALWATNFVLETISNLSTSSSWVVSASVPVESGGSFLTTNLINSTSGFYRLRSR